MNIPTTNDTPQLILSALKHRLPLFDPDHRFALRLLNGFTEGLPDLSADIFAKTLLLHNYADFPQEGISLAHLAKTVILNQLPWIVTVVLKSHRSPDFEKRRGEIIHGANSDKTILEHEVRYAIDLTMNQDASLYLDTRNLRKWLQENMRDKTVLNTFAYTGSLGVAAMSGGARQVVHTDINRKFLNVAKDSYTLNGFPILKGDFISADFFQVMGRLKKENRLFDCVILDPPFFSTTSAGKVDLVTENHRLINKVRPLIAHNGYLISVNNALFLSGNDYLSMLQQICADGYLKIETFIPVSADITGFSHNFQAAFPANPAPFNHPTKIAILKVFRKSS